MRSTSKYWKESLCGLLLALIVTSEAFYRFPLYNYGLGLIAHWQRTAPMPFTADLSKSISFFGTETALTVLLLSVFCLAPRRLFLKLAAIYFVHQCICSFFKALYRDPRPYFSSDFVSAITCTKGYGNPSGHSLSAVAVFGGLWAMAYGEDWGKSLFQKSWIRAAVMWASFSLILALIFGTLFARMFLGVHSLDHVIYGALLGLWTVFCLAVTLRHSIDSHLEFVIRDRQQFRPSLGGIIVITSLVMVQILNFVVLFTLDGGPEALEKAWIARINKKCPGMFKNWDLAEDAFRGLLHTTLYPLIYFSQLFSSRLFPSAFANWSASIGPLKMLCRAILSATLLGVCFLPYFAVSGTESFALSMAIGIFLPNLVIAFFGFPAIDWLSLKLGLVGTPEVTVEAESCRYIEMQGRDKGKKTEYARLGEGMQESIKNLIIEDKPQQQQAK